MATFNVNTDEVIRFTAKLERLNKSAFPSAVRNTLNGAAFETRNLLPTVGAKKFKYQRNKSFLKYFSTVDKAQGFNVNKMVSTVGIDASKDRVLAQNLESQEFGGVVLGKKIIPHDKSRTGGSIAKRVARRNAMDKVKAHNGTNAFRRHRGSKKSKFVAAVMGTAKAGKSHMILKSGNRGMIYHIRSLSQNRRTRKVNFKVKKLYSVRNTNKHSVKSVGFMKSSALAASKDMNKMYIKNAEYQFKKVLR